MFKFSRFRILRFLFLRFGRGSGKSRKFGPRENFPLYGMLKLTCFLLGFYEALLGLLKPIDKEVQCLDLQLFHVEAFEFMMILCSL